MADETSVEYEAAQRAYRDATDRLVAVLPKVVAERVAELAGTSVRGIVVLAVEGEGDPSTETVRVLVRDGEAAPDITIDLENAVKPELDWLFVLDRERLARGFIVGVPGGEVQLLSTESETGGVETVA
ncbi:MAG: hypothetical protein ACYCXY_13695 [Acidimicrobiales bacterium]